MKKIKWTKRKIGYIILFVVIVILANLITQAQFDKIIQPVIVFILADTALMFVNRRKKKTGNKEK